MRRAAQKIKIAYYEGKRVGISEAIELFYKQNGYNSNTFNMAALMRKEYIRTLSLENLARNILHNTTKKGKPWQ